MPNIIEITDFNSKELDVYARLTEAQLKNKLESEKGLFIAESPKVINTALDEGYVPISLLTEPAHLQNDARELVKRLGDTPIYTAERKILENLTGYTLTRGVLCAMRRPAIKTLDEVLDGAKRVAVLENIVDSTNMGAIFRSAAALGIDAVLLTPSASDPLLRRCVRVSMGTVFQVPWTFIGNEKNEWPNSMKSLSERGFKTVAMALCDDSISLDDPRLKSEEKLAILLGTEGDGLKKETIAACDYTVKIPMFHDVDSLNVGAAAALAFWELRTK